jgi:hypothetical protein
MLVVHVPFCRNYVLKVYVVIISYVVIGNRNNPKQPKTERTKGPTRNEPKPMTWPEGSTETENFVFSGNLNNNVIAKESL